MKTLGTRLLHLHSLINIIEPMPPDLVAATQQLFTQDPDLSESDLLRELRKWFGLVPLQLGNLQSITVNVAPHVDRTGRPHPYYLAEARLNYTGSPLLWRYSPGGYPDFPYRGVAASTSVGWRKFITSKDVAPFETEVRQVLAETQAQLAEFCAEVRRIDGYINNFIDAHMKTLLTYKPQTP